MELQKIRFNSFTTLFDIPIKTYLLFLMHGKMPVFMVSSKRTRYIVNGKAKFGIDNIFSFLL